MQRVRAPITRTQLRSLARDPERTIRMKEMIGSEGFYQLYEISNRQENVRVGSKFKGILLMSSKHSKLLRKPFLLWWLHTQDAARVRKGTSAPLERSRLLSRVWDLQVKFKEEVRKDNFICERDIVSPRTVWQASICKQSIAKRWRERGGKW